MIRPFEMWKLAKVLWEDLVESELKLSRFPMITEMYHRVSAHLVASAKLEWTQEEEDRLFEEGHRLYRLPGEDFPWE